eukprot:comp21703_c0_seq2/m.30634 comp21703_c0_seq2/g.30634  ORF comp21703_c0_seq2/g.30634 comp21703_c0_seq2/m.30634 type:complete len:310 (-) comp21703_c0_seq2:11-940(-)
MGANMGDRFDQRGSETLRRTRKRIQLEWNKLRIDPLPRVLLKLGSLFGSLLLLLVLFNALGGHVIQQRGVSLRPASKAVSIVVPTYRENENIPVLCQRVFAALQGEDIEAELIIVDDNSQDGSVDTVLELQRTYNVTIVVRKREKGLSSAVIHGFGHPKHDVMMVMDADLSHPPETIPSLLQPLFSGQADMVVASRHVQGGGTRDWPLVRRIISWGATLLAWPVTSVRDPMSGFFALTRDLYVRGMHDLNPMGFKIGLELLVKARPHHVVEVPFIFVDRVRALCVLYVLSARAIRPSHTSTCRLWRVGV